MSYLICRCTGDILFNLLSPNITKWSNTLKQFVRKLPTNCLSVFYHFVGLALKVLKLPLSSYTRNWILRILTIYFDPETDDHGPINTWDRVPYITDLYDGKPSLSVQENQIYRNFLINNYRSVWPIDHDDGSCFWNDTYNYMVYGGLKL